MKVSDFIKQVIDECHARGLPWEVRAVSLTQVCGLGHLCLFIGEERLYRSRQYTADGEMIGTVDGLDEVRGAADAIENRRLAREATEEEIPF